MSRLGIDRNTLQQRIQVGDVRVGNERALERCPGRFVTLLRQVMKKREVDDLAIDEAAVVITQVPAIDKQVT